MAYVQRASGIFIRQNLLPQADLQAEHTFPEGQYIAPGIQQVLSYLTGQNAAGARMLQVDANANLLVTSGNAGSSLGKPTQINLVPTRTDTTSQTLGPFITPPFTVALFTYITTAVSGTSPTLSVNIASTASDGNVHGTSGGGLSGNMTSVTALAFAITPSTATSQLLLGPTFVLQIAIGGTTPSFTYKIDMTYK